MSSLKLYILYTFRTLWFCPLTDETPDTLRDSLVICPVAETGRDLPSPLHLSFPWWVLSKPYKAVQNTKLNTGLPPDKFPNAKRQKWMKELESLGNFWHQNQVRLKLFSFFWEGHAKLKRTYGSWGLQPTTPAHCRLPPNSKYLHPREDSALYISVAGTHKKVWLFHLYQWEPQVKESYIWSKGNEVCETPALQLCQSMDRTAPLTTQAWMQGHMIFHWWAKSQSGEILGKKKANQGSHYRITKRKLGCLIWKKW